MISDVLLILTFALLVLGGLALVAPIAAYALRGDEMGERLEDHLEVAHVVGVLMLIAVIPLGMLTIAFALAGN